MLSVYFAQKAFVVSEGRLLLVRRSASDPRHPLFWEVPGGRLEPGEGLDDHIAREVQEETGIRIAVGEPFFVWKWSIPPKAGAPDTIVGLARICRAQSGELSADGRVEDDNLDLMEWVPLSELVNRKWIPNMIPVVEAFLAKIGRDPKRF